VVTPYISFPNQHFFTQKNTDESTMYHLRICDVYMKYILENIMVAPQKTKAAFYGVYTASIVKILRYYN
jgi:hypothetical protein